MRKLGTRWDPNPACLTSWVSVLTIYITGSVHSKSAQTRAKYSISGAPSQDLTWNSSY